MAPQAPTPEGALTLRELNRATLARQGLLEPIDGGDPASAVERLGSLQAQHPEWPPIALAARAATPPSADLTGALDRREVVRASLMRITIQVVTATDLWPMFTVCQSLRLSQWRLLAKADPIDSPLGRRMLAAHGAAIDALAEAPRSSLEIDRILEREAGAVASPVPRIHWRHFAALVPLVHVPHDGEGYGRSRYALAKRWLGISPPEWDEAEARRSVTRRYLAAFGPSSLDDLAAYVGRGKGGIGVWRTAIHELRGELIELRDPDRRTLYDLADAPRPPGDVPAPPRLLARWDSLLLSHEPKRRDRVIADEHRPTVYSKNADVLPTFLVDGLVAGTWELARGSGRAHIDLRPFGRLRTAERHLLVAEAERILALIAPDVSNRTAAVGRS